MKRVLCLVIAIVLTGALSLAAKDKKDKNKKEDQEQQQQQEAAPAGPHMPQAKTQEEFQAYQTAVGGANGAAIEAAANDFVMKFPDSELRPLVLLKAMNTYQNENNGDKAIEMGRRVLQLDANNTQALVTVAEFLARRTRETDLDREDKYAEATKDANQALQLVQGDLPLPPQLTPEQVEAYKNEIRLEAYDALGTIEMGKKNYAGAEQNYRKATELNTSQPDPVVWLRLSIALDQQKKYPDALTAANKAVQFAPPGSAVGNMATAQRDKLAKLAAAPAAPAQPATPPKQ